MLIQEVPVCCDSSLQITEQQLNNKEAVLKILAHPGHKHSCTQSAEWEKLHLVQKKLLIPVAMLQN